MPVVNYRMVVATEEQITNELVLVHEVEGMDGVREHIAAKHWPHKLCLQLLREALVSVSAPVIEDVDVDEHGPEV